MRKTLEAHAARMRERNEKPKSRTRSPFTGRCAECGKPVDSPKKFCGRGCSGLFGVRSNRDWEYAVAKKLSDEEWTIFHPTACCDRIGVKNGKVYFLEFKPEGKTALRKHQSALKALAPHMFRVVVGKKDAEVVSNKNPKYRGTSKEEAGRWRARIWDGSKTVHLGRFDTEEEAAHAYDVAAKKYRGKAARRNLIGQELGQN